MATETPVDYRLILNSAPDAYLVLDPGLVIVAVTDEYLRLTLTDREEILGRHLFEVFPDDPADNLANGVVNLRASLQSVLEHRAAHAMPIQRYAIRTPHSEVFEERYWLPHNEPVLDDQGNLCYIIHRVRDVTRLQRAETEISRLNQGLERRADELDIAMREVDRAQMVKRDFLSRMSHELRTPLNSILGYAQLMELQGKDTMTKEVSRAILKGGKHLLQLINEVLDLARLDAGKVSISVEPIRIAAIMEQAVGLIRMMAAERGIGIIEDAAGTGDLCVLGDSQRVLQILLNLLSNAVKYNRPDGTIRIRSLSTREGFQRIEVADTGLGLGEGAESWIFRPFERHHRDVEEGTGLGLALSKGLADVMGGRLLLIESSDRGTTFAFELPLVKPPETAEVEAVKEPWWDRWHGIHSLRVLYIEDNLYNCRLIERVFEELGGVDLRIALDATNGIRLARTDHPDVILLDLHLPDLSGMDALKVLRADPLTHDIPVLVISADATEAPLREALDHGAAAYLTKPLDLSSLFAELAKVKRKAA